MNSIKKLYATDMDGTLLDSQKQLAPENIRAINAVVAKDVKVVVCTGRPMIGKQLRMVADK